MILAENCVATMWETWRRQVLPENVNRVQYDETRKAFYAGVFSMLVHQRDTSGDESVTEAQGCAMLQAMYDECVTFFRGMRNV